MTPKIIHVTPLQYILHGPKWVFLSSLFGFFAFLVAIITCCLYFFTRSAVRLKNGTKYYINESTYNLIVNATFATTSFLFWIAVLISYLTIFPPISTISILFFLGILINIAFIIVDSIFLSLKQKTPCPLGSYLDTLNGICINGCQSSKDCPSQSTCIGGLCCSTQTHINCGGLCCPIHNCLENQTICCPPESFCPSTKECCGAGTVPTPSGCVAICGPYTCPNPTDYCLSIPGDETILQQFQFPSPSTVLDNTLYTCMPTPQECTSLSTPEAVPYTISGFYPCFDSQGLDVKSALSQNLQTSQGREQVLQQFQQSSINQGYNGFFCGAEQTERVLGTAYHDPSQTCTIHNCLNDVAQNTVAMTILTDTSYQQLQCNMLLNCQTNNEASVNNNTSLTGYNLSHVEQNDHGTTLLSPSTFTPFLPINYIPPTSATQSSTIYQTNCAVFQSQGIDTTGFSNVCPFDTSGTYIECELDLTENVGYIKPFVPVMTRDYTVRFGLCTNGASDSGIVDLFGPNTDGDVLELFQQNSQWYVFPMMIRGGGFGDTWGNGSVAIQDTSGSSNSSHYAFSYLKRLSSINLPNCLVNIQCLLQTNASIYEYFYWIAIGLLPQSVNMSVYPQNYKILATNQFPQSLLQWPSQYQHQAIVASIPFSSSLSSFVKGSHTYNMMLVQQNGSGPPQLGITAIANCPAFVDRCSLLEQNDCYSYNLDPTQSSNVSDASVLSFQILSNATNHQFVFDIVSLPTSSSSDASGTYLLPSKFNTQSPVYVFYAFSDPKQMGVVFGLQYSINDGLLSYSRYYNSNYCDVLSWAEPVTLLLVQDQGPY